MRLPRRYSPCQWLSLLLPMAESLTTPVITLSAFQQINGFSVSCTTAYNTPIIGCTAADFVNNTPCSSDCISDLQSVSRLVNAACQGTSTSPSTLIGLIFQGNGVEALCPNSGDGTVAPPQYASSTSMHVTKSTSTTAAAVSTQPSPTIFPRTSSTTSSTTSTTSTLSTDSGSSSPSSDVATDSASAAANAAASSSSTAATNSATAQPTNSNGDGFSGGGSPFDISSPGSQSTPNWTGMSFGGSLFVIALWLM